MEGVQAKETAVKIGSQFVVAFSAVLLTACATTSPDQLASTERSARLCNPTAPSAAFDQCMRRYRVNLPTIYSVADQRAAIYRALAWIYRHPDWADKTRRADQLLELKMRLKRLPKSGIEWGIQPLPRNTKVDSLSLPETWSHGRWLLPSTGNAH